MTAKKIPVNSFAKRWKGEPPTRRKDFRDKESAWAAFEFAIVLANFGYIKHAIVASLLPQKVYAVYIWV